MTEATESTPSQISMTIMGLELPQPISDKIPFRDVLFSPIAFLAFLDTPIGIPAAQKRASKPRPKRRATMAAKKPTPKNEKPAPNLAFAIEGRVEAGSGTRFSINRVDFVVDPNTFTVGMLDSGCFARVTGKILPNGEHRARQITVLQTN